MNVIQDELARQTIRAAFQAANRLESAESYRVLTTIRATESGDGVDFGVRAMVSGRYQDEVFRFKPGDTRRWMLSVVLPWVRQAVDRMKSAP